MHPPSFQKPSTNRTSNRHRFNTTVNPGSHCFTWSRTARTSYNLRINGKSSPRQLDTSRTRGLNPWQKDWMSEQSPGNKRPYEHENQVHDWTGCAVIHSLWSATSRWLDVFDLPWPRHNLNSYGPIELYESWTVALDEEQFRFPEGIVPQAQFPVEEENSIIQIRIGQ
jgi:hypothetical protein